ncbi:MAG: aminodeoxychorismate synthase component I [Cyclobacteriaceae bacterium]
MLSKSEAIKEIDRLAAQKTPFVFFTDFEGEKVWVKPLKDLSEKDLRWDFSENQKPQRDPHLSFTFSKSPLSFEQFKPVFARVVEQINYGNSFLVNLTFKTPIDTSLSLDDIFQRSSAKYKLKFGERFVVFSPETFVQMKDGYVYSYPMKGTVDASIENAKEQILNDPKETAEHVTIADLIRNDLSQIADEVRVTKFRFISEVKTHEKKLLQVSSEIRGKLPDDYLCKLGTLLFRLLPAGSITGAPKPKTVEIIQSAENYDRGFYTGICGHFDGQNLDTGVMIRFIEKQGDQLYYKSGGGITSFSNAEKEYQELIDKIYLPF